MLPSPDDYGLYAQELATGLAGDPGAMLNTIETKASTMRDFQGAAVCCADNRHSGSGALPAPAMVVDANLNTTAHVSRFAFTVLGWGPFWWQDCETWPWAPPAPFYGPFNATTKNPVLIISNTVRVTGGFV